MRCGCFGIWKQVLDLFNFYSIIPLGAKLLQLASNYCFYHFVVNLIFLLNHSLFARVGRLIPWL